MRKIVVIIIVLGMVGVLLFLYNLPAHSPPTTSYPTQILVMPFDAQGQPGKDVTLNAGPDDAFEEVATIYSGSAVRIIGISIDLKWYLVEYDDSQGQTVQAWVSADSLVITAPPIEPGPRNPDPGAGGEGEEPPVGGLPPIPPVLPGTSSETQPEILPINPQNVIFPDPLHPCMERDCISIGTSLANNPPLLISSQTSPFSQTDSINPAIFFSLTKTSIPFYVPPTFTKPPFIISPTIIKPLFITPTYTKVPFIISSTATKSPSKTPTAKPPSKTPTTKPPLVTPIIKPPPISPTAKPPPTKYPTDTKPPPIPTSTPKLILKPTSTSKFGPTPTLSK